VPVIVPSWQKKPAAPAQVARSARELNPPVGEDCTDTRCDGSTRPPGAARRADSAGTLRPAPVAPHRTELLRRCEPRGLPDRDPADWFRAGSELLWPRLFFRIFRWG